MNVSDLYQEIGRKLGDPNNQQWSTGILLPRINRSQTKILVLTNSVKTKETLTATSGSPTVQLDTDVIDVIRIDIQDSNGNWKKLDGMLRDQLDFQYPNWQQLNNGQPFCYWWDGTNQQVNLVPAPDSANAITNGLRVWEIQKPNDLAATTDVPFGSNAAMIPYHPAIVEDVVADCFEDLATPEALAKARFHRSGTMSNPGRFEQEIKRINAKFDAPEDVPVRMLWKPTGGRLTGGFSDRKVYPFS